MQNFKIYAFADEAGPMIDDQIVAMKRNGLNGLEIRGVDNVNISDISEAKAKEVISKIENAGLSVWSIGSPIGKIDIEKDDFDAHIEKFKHTLEIANILKAKNMRIFSFFMPKDKPYENYRNEVIDRLGVLCELSKGSGVDLCHENEKGIYGDTAVRCNEILTALPQLKGVFDPANFIQCGEDTLAAWELLKDKIHYLHIKDALESGDVVPAGCGIGNIPVILKDYVSRGGSAATLEPHLAVFSGLNDLEREGEKSQVGAYHYPDNNTAFDAACKAFSDILKEI
ncbi:MAG: sugar phosphate isomerase/epimerase [Clostridia bacterium]|nr:sugar phosphate isomerase/epimerase [Clostridia bacterium]